VLSEQLARRATPLTSAFLFISSVFFLNLSVSILGLSVSSLALVASASNLTFSSPYFASSVSNLVCFNSCCVISIISTLLIKESI